MAPTSALVAVSEGTAVSFLEPLSSCQPMIIRVRGAQSWNQDVHPERELRFPADGWGLPAVICGTTQSPRGKYVLDGARGRPRLREGSDLLTIAQHIGCRRGVPAASAHPVSL